MARCQWAATSRSGVPLPTKKFEAIRFQSRYEERLTRLAILISFDIDGTLEVGDPPGVLTMELVRKTQEAGILVGSCSDRPISGQRAIWEQHGIAYDFAVSKHQLPDVKERFEAEAYYHIGDREDLDRQYALAAGFEFFWPDEAVSEPWLK